MRKPTASCASLLLALLLVPAPSQARWMSPDAGRFQTMDSYEGTQEEPLTLHKYLYCHGDPINGTDPTGLSENLLVFEIGQGMRGILGAMVVVGGVYAAVQVARSLPPVALPESFTGTSSTTIGELAPETKPPPKPIPPIIAAPTPQGRDDEPVLIISKSASKMPSIAAHIEKAQDPTRGSWSYPARLSRGLGTEDFRRNQRRLALKGIGRAPAGKSWDEYPFASTIEGGGSTSVEPVPIEEQLVQGGVINHFYSLHGLIYADHFWVIIVP
jgi:hypothetical protein